MQGVNNQCIIRSQLKNKNIMNIIPFTECSRPCYPIGENIRDALHYIDQVTPFIKELIADKAVNIWCSGSSGAILSAFLIKNLDNKCIICHVKKEGENSHHGNSFYSKYYENCVNIILDDFMRSGRTIERIYEQAKECEVTIDILVLANAYQEPWSLSFKPTNLIIDESSIHNSWKD